MPHRQPELTAKCFESAEQPSWAAALQADQAPEQLSPVRADSEQVPLLDKTAACSGLAQENRQFTTAQNASEQPYRFAPEFTYTNRRTRTKLKLSLVFFLIGGFLTFLILRSNELNLAIDTVLINCIPGSAKAHALMARDLELALGADEKQKSKAIEHWDKAIALDPKEPEYYSSRAEQWTRQAKFQKAFADYSTAISLNPPSFLLGYHYFHRAAIAKELGLWRQCITDCQEAITLNPYQAKYRLYELADAPNIAELTAFSLEKLGKGSEALAKYTESVNQLQGSDTAGKSRDGLMARANYYLRQNDYEKALLDCDAALDGISPQSDWFLLRAKVLMKLGKNDRALVDLNRALDLDPELAAALSIRAELLKQLGKLKESEEDKRALKKLDSQSTSPETEF